jgi:transposase
VVGARFAVSRSYVIKARHRRDRQGVPCVGGQRSHTPTKLASMTLFCIRVYRPTLAELLDWGERERSISLTIKAIRKQLNALNLTLKACQGPFHI